MTVPTNPRKLAQDPRFQDPNWTTGEGFTLKQVARAEFAARFGNDWDAARAEVDYLWEQAAIATMPTLAVA